MPLNRCPIFSPDCDGISNNHNVHLHNVALSNAAGEATFNHVVTNPAYSGLGETEIRPA
jgi:hypothetical protein